VCICNAQSVLTEALTRRNFRVAFAVVSNPELLKESAAVED